MSGIVIRFGSTGGLEEIDNLWTSLPPTPLAEDAVVVGRNCVDVWVCLSEECGGDGSCPRPIALATGPRELTALSWDPRREEETSVRLLLVGA